MPMSSRMNTKTVMVGNVPVGGGHPIAIQSMTNTKTEDIEATIRQIHRLEEAGCQIVRATVPTPEAASAFSQIRKEIHIPLVADIHFNYKLAIMAMENGGLKRLLWPRIRGTTFEPSAYSSRWEP